MKRNILNNEGDFSVSNLSSHAHGNRSSSRAAGFRNDGGGPLVKTPCFRQPECYLALESSDPRLQLQAALRQIDKLLVENAQLKKRQSDRDN